MYVKEKEPFDWPKLYLASISDGWMCKGCIVLVHPALDCSQTVALRKTLTSLLMDMCFSEHQMEEITDF